VVNFYFDGSQIASGSNTGSVVASGSIQGIGPVSITIPVLVFSSGTAPTISSFVNGASFTTGPVSPGEITTFFGTALGPANGTGFSLLSNGSVAPGTGSVGVFFDGHPATVLYASATQLNVVTPLEIAGQTSTKAQVVYFGNGTATAAATLSASPSAPGIFLLNVSSNSQGAVLNQDFTVNGPTNPAAGGSYIAVFATGLGVTSPAGQDDGVNPQSAPFPATVAPVTMTIGGQPVAPTYAGGAPGLVNGVNQVNAQIPMGLSSPAGVQLTVNGQKSNIANVYVK
jgi:uncharacterized protein (TIGR03437 family)